MKWQFGLGSEIGGRAEQQDCIDVFAVPGRHGHHLAVLADGMGGHQDGRLAAQTVIDTARRYVAEVAIERPGHFLETLCLKAHAAILDIGRQRDSDLASTGVFLYVGGDEAYWAHVGDSRLYHFATDRLQSQTCDHTVGELLRSEHPFAGGTVEDGRLYQCLGGYNDMRPETAATAIGDDDWFLLCSDGLWNQLEPSDFVAHRPAAGLADGAARTLARLASERGGPRSDNVSVILAAPKVSLLKSAWRRLGTS